MVRYFVDVSGVYQALANGNLLYVWYDKHWKLISTEMSMETLEAMHADGFIFFLTCYEAEEATGELLWN